MAKIKVTNKTLQVLNILRGRKKNATMQLVPKQSIVIDKSEMTDHIRSLVAIGAVEARNIAEILEV